MSMAIEHQILGALARNTARLQQGASRAASRAREGLVEYQQQLDRMSTDIEHQILEAFARNTARLQRRSARASARARDAMDDHQRQQSLIIRSQG